MAFQLTKHDGQLQLSLEEREGRVVVSGLPRLPGGKPGLAEAGARVGSGRAGREAGLTLTTIASQAITCITTCK